MPVIKPRTRGKHLVEHRTRLDRDNHETLYAYAAFVEEEPDYVINQLVETVLAKDKEFLPWRVAHPHSHAPQRVVKTHHARRIPFARHRSTSPAASADNGVRSAADR